MIIWEEVGQKQKKRKPISRVLSAVGVSYPNNVLSFISNKSHPLPLTTYPLASNEPLVFSCPNPPAYLVFQRIRFTVPRLLPAER